MQDETDAESTGLASEEIQAAIKPENVRQLKIGIATVAACLVKAIDDGDKRIEQRFVGLLDNAHDNYRNYSDADPQHVLELIHWTREMIKGWNPVPGRTNAVFDQEEQSAETGPR